MPDVVDLHGGKAKGRRSQRHGALRQAGCSCDAGAQVTAIEASGGKAQGQGKTIGKTLIDLNPGEQEARSDRLPCRVAIDGTSYEIPDGLFASWFEARDSTTAAADRDQWHGQRGKTSDNADHVDSIIRRMTDQDMGDMMIIAQPVASQSL